ncbi:Gfo/Idh/MocA family oxidoreductase [Flavobacteriaceae bacterium]|nr:Gfo/Idh/MocA family oxidoreductase [Flavobacteriaceae bacterium]MDC3227709.1 Gfo/Idh/MocA family oxidoreductase [Flavobacteriaceae bacterium]
MINVGVIGIGHLGSIHLKLLLKSDSFKVIGCFDKNTSLKSKINSDVCFYEDVNQLILKCDALFVCSNTPSHYEMVKLCLINNKHVFVEKPITTTLEEALELVKLTEKNNLIGQVGHVERFNPAITSVLDIIDKPKFIECHRLAEFNPRGNDVSVVLDLMIHDIDIVLKVIDSNIKNVSANGVAVISDSPDITNARVEFENGAVANFTASRISLKNMRKTRLFQNNAYISVDFLDKKSEVVKITNFQEEKNNYAMVIENIKGEKKQIYYSNPELKPVNSIIEEHNNFAKSIINKSSPLVSFKDGFNALELAIKIINKVDGNS